MKRSGFTAGLTAGAIALLCMSLPSFAAGAEIVAVKGTKKVVALSATGAVTRTLFRMRRGYIADLAASRAGGRIAFIVALPPRRPANGRGHLRPERIWTMSGSGARAHVIRRLRSRTDGEIAHLESVDISPDGGRIAVATRDWIAVMHADGTSYRRVRTPGFKPALGSLYYEGGPEFASAGRLLSSFRTIGPRKNRRRGIGTVSVSGGRVHWIRRGRLETAAARGFSPTISEDGKRIAFIASITKQNRHNRYQEIERQRIFLMRRDGSHLRRLRAHLSTRWALSNLDFSPSGHALVFGTESRGPGGGFAWGVDPTAVGIVPRDGSRLRLLDVEPLRGWTRGPAWIR